MVLHSVVAPSINTSEKRATFWQLVIFWLHNAKFYISLSILSLDALVFLSV